ncbi:molecular chaperone [Cytobacillus sp. Hz8]|uniref:TorD/DmsD family molecular chaperone n=1 Tax=Cytobacillus sp. Hz8 TaxID=3347168 RepID=UPI0035E253AC
MITETSLELSKTRGIVYQWISNMILLEPNEQNFQFLVSNKIIDAIKKMVEYTVYGDNLIQAIVDWRCEPGFKEKMIEDFNELFCIPGPKYIYPFESCYRERLVDDSIGKIYGCTTLEVSQIYKVLSIRFNKKEIPDHLGIELLFMSELCYLEGANSENNQKVDAQKLFEWQKGFLNDHLFKWGFEVLKNMEEKAETDFYRSIAQMSIDFLEEERSIFI